LRVHAFAYLKDVFARTSAHPNRRLEELPPDRSVAALRS